MSYEGFPLVQLFLDNQPQATPVADSSRLVHETTEESGVIGVRNLIEPISTAKPRHTNAVELAANALTIMNATSGRHWRHAPTLSSHAVTAAAPALA